MTGPDAFQALADKGRRDILMLISREKLTINAIAENFEISRPAVSKHIKILEQAGFIHIEEKGRERYCVLHEEGFSEVKAWITYFEAYWTDQLKALDRILSGEFPAKKPS